MERHKHEIEITRVEDWGYKTGYCKTCFVDMAINTKGEQLHYKSHGEAIKKGLWGKK